jgi:hypothetical protein
MKKSAYTEIEPVSIIVSEHYRKQVKLHNRLRNENGRIVREAEAWRRQAFSLDSPALLIRLKQDAEGIPAGIIIEAPLELSLALIRLRAATPVGDFSRAADVVISDDDLGQATA